MIALSSEGMGGRERTMAGQGREAKTVGNRDHSINAPGTQTFRAARDVTAFRDWKDAGRTGQTVTTRRVRERDGGTPPSLTLP